MGSTVVKLRSAIKLDEKSLKTLAKFIKDEQGVEADFEVKIDPELIAGFKFNVKGIEYDFSLSGSLSRLQQEL